MSEASQSSNRWSDLRDFCSAVRELVIVGAMLALVVAPSLIRQALERAGIRSVAGVEFDVAPIAKNRQELDQALAQIASLQEQLATASTAVHGLVESSPAIAMADPSTPRLQSNGAPRFAPSLASVSRMIDSMKLQTDQVDRSLRRSKDRTDEFLEQAGQKIHLTPPDELFRHLDPPPAAASLSIAREELQR